MIASVSGRRSVTVVPWPGTGRQIDRAAHVLDGALDHVHADAAAGQRRDGLRGREARMEQELVELMVGQRGAGRDQPLLLRLGADARRVEAAAIVLDGDQHLRAGMHGVQSIRPCSVLPAAVRLAVSSMP